MFPKQLSMFFHLALTKVYMHHLQQVTDHAPISFLLLCGLQHVPKKVHMLHIPVAQGYKTRSFQASLETGASKGKEKERRKLKAKITKVA